MSEGMSWYVDVDAAGSGGRWPGRKVAESESVPVRNPVT